MLNPVGNEGYLETFEKDSPEVDPSIQQIERDTYEVLRHTNKCLLRVLKGLKNDLELHEIETREAAIDLRTLCGDTNSEAQISKYIAELIQSALFSD